MIVFEKIRWKNFLSTGNTFTEMTLNESKSQLVIGSNGAGKSTTMRMITGYIPPTAGVVRIGDHDAVSYTHLTLPTKA